jgi:hypothetical protein
MMNSPPQKRFPANLTIKNVDREGQELRVGDRVGFIMRGWYLQREQESFGVIADIDSRGGIRIDVIESYRCFTSSQQVGIRTKSVYFTHHVYDPSEKTRVFAKEEGEHLLSIFRIDSDEIEWHLAEARKAEALHKTESLAAAHESNDKGR